MILVAGGDLDPNLQALAATLTERGEPVFFLKTGAELHPSVTWDLVADRLLIDGEEIRPRAAFLRHDVFTHLADRRPESSFRAFAWYTAVAGWVASHADVRVPNRAALHQSTNKPHALWLARECGLAIPETRLTNHIGGLDPDRPQIVKPVNGGGYCERLSDVLARTETRGDGIAAAPALIQPELVQPEIRVYGIGGVFLPFSMSSEDLDYRVKQSARVALLPEVPECLSEGLGRLMERMGLDFAAADFKTCPDTGRLLFLEINAGPMFAAFDRVSDRAVTRTLADLLSQEKPAL